MENTSRRFLFSALESSKAVQETSIQVIPMTMQPLKMVERYLFK